MYCLGRVWPTLRSRRGALVIWERGRAPFRRWPELIQLAESYTLSYLLAFRDPSSASLRVNHPPG